MDNASIERKKLTLTQTISALKKLAKENSLEWTDELNVDFSNEVEFMLGSKGRWLLCHMGKSSPFVIRFRLIGERTYERVKPANFIGVASKILLH